MRANLIAATAGAWFSAALVLLTPGAGNAAAAEPNVKLEVQLIWATNDARSPDPTHKAVDAAILKKLTALPLKWSNYFEVNRKRFEVPPTGTTNVALGKCAIGVKKLVDSAMQVSFIGKGKPVETRTMKVPKGEGKGDVLIYGGNAPNDTAYFVTLKRVE
jgi:hypothetical protein